MQFVMWSGVVKSTPHHVQFAGMHPGGPQTVHGGPAPHQATQPWVLPQLLEQSEAAKPAEEETLSLMAVGSPMGHEFPVVNVAISVPAPTPPV